MCVFRLVSSMTAMHPSPRPPSPPIALILIIPAIHPAGRRSSMSSLGGVVVPGIAGDLVVGIAVGRHCRRLLLQEVVALGGCSRRLLFQEVVVPGIAGGHRLDLAFQGFARGYLCIKQCVNYAFQQPKFDTNRMVFRPVSIGRICIAQSVNWEILEHKLDTSHVFLVAFETFTPDGCHCRESSSLQGDIVARGCHCSAKYDVVGRCCHF